MTEPLDAVPRRAETAARRNLVVAGHDLKFMDLLLPLLREHFTVEIDAWQSHAAHDERRSQELLEWADVVWVEWLLGAAVWYAARVRPEQRLVVRAHRSEWGVAYGERLDVDRVDAFVTVSPHCRADFIDRFDLPADKTWMVPNAVDVDGYRRGDAPERAFALAMVGALPRLKGLHRALELLSQLRAADDRYTLTIYGKSPEELPWLMKIAEETAYFASCSQYVADKGLGEAVTWAGWVNTREALAGHGVVLSTSDLEGFHIAPAEAFCAGGVGLFLDWRGAAQLYPGEFISRDVAGLRDAVLSLQDPDRLAAASARGRDWVRSRYDTAVARRRVEEMLRTVGVLNE